MGLVLSIAFIQLHMPDYKSQTDICENEPAEGLPIKGRYYYVTGDRRIVYEDGEEVIYEYDSEEEGWFEVI